ncbi:MAG: hypothetical protein HY736_27845 [Verrucomicrobia bacterium]|nr:hypothetical protein [Verrucomicrobiota bacterium]
MPARVILLCALLTLPLAAATPEHPGMGPDIYDPKADGKAQIATGKQLTTQETGALEDGDRHSPKKVLAFLDRWKPKKSKGAL